MILKKNFFFTFVEHTTVKTKKEDPFITQLWKQNRLGGRKGDQADILYDIFIPSILIVGLLIVNAFILLIIWRYRQKRYIFFKFNMVYNEKFD